MSHSKFRLVTRSDFDGLVCAVLLKDLDMIDEIKFVHPKDMQDGKVEITPRDITTNLPYVAAAHLSFDHHESETLRQVNAATTSFRHMRPLQRGWCTTITAEPGRFRASVRR